MEFTSILEKMSVLEKDNNRLQLEQKVLEAGVLFSDKERNWHLKQIAEGTTNESKIDFYIWAAKQRESILENAPADKQNQIKKSIDHLLDQSSNGDREGKKRKPLEQMREAVLQFRENQRLVTEKTRKLRNLPVGFESKIWDRFMTRFEKEAGGNVLDAKVMAKFRQSIETTFRHLAKVLDMQETIKQKLDSENYFNLKSKDGILSERARLSATLQTQIFDWLDQGTHLRDWEKGLEKLMQKQLPQNLKEFKEHYSQVFTPEFWKEISSTNPMEMPNFTVAFNFQTEDRFMTKMTLSDIKKMPQKIKKALLADGKEILSEFFSTDEQKKALSQLKSISEKNPTKLLKIIAILRREQEQKRNEAYKTLGKIKQLYFDKDTKSAQSELTLFKNRYGENILHSLMEDKFQGMVDLRMMRITNLEEQLKLTQDQQRQKQIQRQLRELCQSKKDHCSLGMSVDERSERVSAIEVEVKMARAVGNLTGAKALAKKLRGLNDVKAELLISEINREIEAKKVTEGANGDQEKKVDASTEKQKKIEFLEKSIEHAEKVKEACSQVGIPTDDPKFWKREGIINRVQWLKDHGLYDMYQKFNGSDPNIPRDAQTGGFRFRWMDSRGDALNGSRATDGLKYLQRYKESGYILAALAGAFSINWKNMGSATYTPDEFITHVSTDLNAIKGQKAK